MRCTVRLWTSAAFVALLLVPTFATGQVSYEFGGGGLTTFDDLQREVYGTAKIFSMGVAAPFGHGPASFFLDAGVARATGDEFGSDPTFDLDDAEWRLIPLTFGMRTRLSRGQPDAKVQMFGALGWQTILTRWEDPLDNASHSPTSGLMVELRPAFRLAPRWDLWVRQRVTVVGEARYGRNRSFNPSGSDLQVGFAFIPSRREEVSQ